MANGRGSVVIAGKYRLGRALARGGMGAVWTAHHLQLDVPVAIKFMDATMNSAPDACMRFEREARSAAMIRSPHVVQIYDHGVDAGRHFIVMELLEGENLGDRLRRDQRLTIPDAANVVLQVAKALRRAHESGIVHRDLKPTNIFLALVDDEEIVKVLDFGIAKAAIDGQANVTRTGMVMGSPSYMSPEQARDIKSVDHRADLWSLGVILFRALTGQMIFRADSSVDMLLKICEEEVPLASSVAPDLPRDFDAFFRRSFCRDLSGRFQSAREMAGTLTDIVRRLGFGGSLVMPSSPGLPASMRPPPFDPYADNRRSAPSPPPASSPGSPQPSALANPSALLHPSPRDSAPRLDAPRDLRGANLSAADLYSGIAQRPLSTPASAFDPPSIPPPPPSAPRSLGEPRLLQLFRARHDSWRPDALPDAGSDASAAPETPAPSSPPRGRSDETTRLDSKVPPPGESSVGVCDVGSPDSGVKGPIRRISGTMARVDRIVEEQRDQKPLTPSPRVANLIDEGFSALRAGDRDAARRCWSEALHLDPSNRMIELNLRRLSAITG
jgi:eukaryotic-like serine/threonine-protein kinase